MLPAQDFEDEKGRVEQLRREEEKEQAEEGPGL